MQEPFWQCWLFDLLVHIEDVKIYANKQEVSLSMLEQEEMLIYDIFAIIHLYCTYYVKGGWRHVERTINAAHLYADKVSVALDLKISIFRFIKYCLWTAAICDIWNFYNM